MGKFLLLWFFLFMCGCGGGGDSNGSSTPSAPASPPNSIPIAKVGADQVVPDLVAVFLDGTDSTDADGDALTYLWEITNKPATSQTSINSITAAEPFFVPDVPGIYTLTLRVNDGLVYSSPVTINVQAVHDINFDRSYLLKGRWSLNYTIVSTFSDQFTIDNFDATPVSGMYPVHGKNQYNNDIVGGYSPLLSKWTFLDTGASSDFYYSFYTDGTNILPGSCFYVIYHPEEEMSPCFSLSGNKQPLSVASKLLSPVSMQKQELEFASLYSNESDLRDSPAYVEYQQIKSLQIR